MYIHTININMKIFEEILISFPKVKISVPYATGTNDN